MYVCMYVCVYLCKCNVFVLRDVHVCMYVCTCVCAYASVMYMRIFILSARSNLQTRMNTPTIYMHSCVNLCFHVCMRICIVDWTTYTYTYSHTCICAYKALSIEITCAECHHSHEWTYVCITCSVRIADSTAVLLLLLADMPAVNPAICSDGDQKIIENNTNYGVSDIIIMRYSERSLHHIACHARLQ
jgi:hypothetical protein